MRKRRLALIVLFVLGAIFLPGNTMGLVERATNTWQVIAQDGGIPFVGEATSFEGTLGILSGDTGTYGVLSLRDGAFVRLVTDDTALLRQYAGQPVRVTGELLDAAAAATDEQVVQVAGIQPLFSQPNVGEAGPTGTLPFVTLICQFSGDTTSGGSTANIEALYTGSGQFSLPNFFSALSYGNLSLAGSVVAGPFMVDNIEANYSGGLVTLMADDCADKADPSVNFDLYGGINFLYNGNSFDAAGGQLTLPSLNNELFRVNIIPEAEWLSMASVAETFGFSFGLPPSAGPANDPKTAGENPSPWDFIAGRALGGCTLSDPTFGCLPVGTIARTLAEDTGWVPDIHEEIVEIGTAREIRVTKTSGPATAVDRYVKVPLDQTNTRFYTIEVRKTDLYDQNLPGTGVIIHHVDNARGNGEIAQVVDQDGNTNQADAGAIWLPGETFVDSANNVTIQILSQDNPNSFDVYVSNAAAARPDTPTGIGVSASTETSISIQWTDVANETGYRIYRFDFQDDGTQWVVRELNVAQDNTTYTDTGLDCGGTYTYQVRSVNLGAESLWSTAINATPSGCPATGILVNEIDMGNIDAVELVNLNAQSVDLINFTVSFYNGNTEAFAYTFASNFTVPAGGYVVLREDAGTNTADTIYMNQNIPWDAGSTGGAVIVRNSIADLVDFVRFGDATLSDPSAEWTLPNIELAPFNGVTMSRDAVATDTNSGVDFFLSAPTLGRTNQTTIAPENDILAQAAVVDTPIIYYEDVSLATAHQTDPAVTTCAANVDRTVWYQYTGETNGETIRVSTARTDYDEVIGVYSGTPDSLVQVACNNGAGNGTSEVAFQIDNGVNYYIMVGRASVGGGDNLVVSFGRDPVYDRSVTGFVYEMDGETPIPNIRVVGFGAQWQDFTCTAEDGSYRLTGAPREFDVTVYADGTDSAYCGNDRYDVEYFKELNFSPGTTFNMDQANADGINFTLEPADGIAPPVPQMISPLDDGGVLTLEDRTPMLSWYAVTGAESYTVTLYDEPGSTPRGEIVYDTAENICDMTSFKFCNVELETPLTYGTYSWSVRATRGSVDSATSSIETFTVGGSTLEAVELLAPVGKIPAGGTSFAVRFAAQYAATAHQITVNGPAGQVFNQQVDTTGCAGQLCTVNVPYSGAVGTYTVSLQPFSLASSGPVSNGTFDVVTVALLPVQLISPRDNAYATNKFSLVFQAQPGVTAHNVTLYDPVGALIVNQTLGIDACSADGICSVDVTTGGDPLGTYQAWIQPLLGTAGGPWTNTTFTMSDAFQINPVQLLAPTGSVLPTDEVLLRWRAQGMTTDHEITIRTGGETIYNKKHDTRHCTGGICEVLVNTNGTEGSHSVDIRAFIGDDFGPVGTSTFVVGALNFQVVELDSPLGVIPAGDTLLLQWYAQPGTTNHTVSLYGPATTLLNGVNVDTRDCSGALCTLEVPYDGANGSYIVWMQPSLVGPNNSVAAGNWNEAGRFTVSSGALLNPVKLLSPTGQINPSDELTLRFEAQANVDTHLVSIGYAGSPLFYYQFIDTTDCAGAVCTVPVAYSGAPGTLVVTLQPFAGGAAGPATNSTFVVGAEDLRPVALTSPRGTIPSSETLMLTFEAQAGTTSHWIDVYGPGGLVFREVVDTRGCAGATCEVIVPYNGAVGTYAVWINPAAGAVGGPWNQSGFTVSDTIDMVPVMLDSPVGNLVPNDRIALTFPAQPGTTAHQVEIAIAGVGEVYDQRMDTRHCAGGQCTVTVPLGNQLGAYTVTLTPYIGLEAGPSADSLFTVESSPLRPVELKSPAGSVQRGELVTLKFDTQPGTTFHYINVYGPLGLVFSEPVDTTGCAGRTCEVIVPYGGVVGEYAVWIQPNAGNVGGPWNGSAFSVNETGGFVPVTLISPIGDENLPGSVLPLRFKADQGISTHTIDVYNPDGTRIFSETVDTRDCSGKECLVEVPYDGAIGQYQVWILPSTEYGAGPWTRSVFSILNVPRQPYLLSPRGTILSSDLLPLRFRTQAGTTTHRVVVKFNGATVYENFVDTAACSGATCAVAVPYDGAEGDYTVELTPYTSTLTGPTGTATFKVGSLSLNPVTPTSPAPFTTIAPSNLLTLKFEAQQGTTAHDLHLYGPGGLLSQQRENTSDCAGRVCTVTIPYAGADGEHAVFIRPHAGSTEGPWTGTVFYVSSLTPLNPVSVYNPANGATIPASNVVELRFNAQAGTTAHEIVVVGQGTFFDRFFDTTSCSGGECAVQVGYVGLPGTYDLGIRPFAGQQAGPWSVQQFTVAAGAPNPVTLTSPTGTIVPDPIITLQFTAQQGTTHHRFDLYDPLGTLLYTNLLPTSECTNNVCTVRVFSNQVEGTYNAWLRPLAGSTSGDWANSTFIVQAPVAPEDQAQVVAVPDPATPLPTDPGDITADILADNLIVQSVCDGTWELTNPFETPLTLAWEAFLSGAEVQTGTVTLEPNTVATLYTDAGATGLSVGLDGDLSLYTEATRGTCE